MSTGGPLTSHAAILDAVDAWEPPIVFAALRPRLLARLLTREAPRRPVDVVTDAATFEAVEAVTYLQWARAARRRADATEVRVADGRLQPIATGEDAAMYVVEVDAVIGGFPVADGALRADLDRRMHERFEAADPVPDPGMTPTDATDRLAEVVGPDAAEDYLTCLQRLWPMRLEGVGLDALEVAVLILAREAGLQKDLGPWVREVGLGTEADVSRAKQALGRDGLLEVSKVTESVGRPRHRLHLQTEPLDVSSRGDLAALEDVLRPPRDEA